MYIYTAATDEGACTRRRQKAGGGRVGNVCRCDWSASLYSKCCGHLSVPNVQRDEPLMQCHGPLDQRLHVGASGEYGVLLTQHKRVCTPHCTPTYLLSLVISSQ